jgi:outer membrane protein assembly factor BamA
MFVSSLEWRFPLKRVEWGTMVPLPLGLHQVSGSVFVDSGGTWNDGGKPEKYSTGAGMEMNARVILFYELPFNLRLGYAHGFDAGGANQVYLRVGASF